MENVEINNKVKPLSIGKLYSFDTETFRYRENDNTERQELYIADFYDGIKHIQFFNITSLRAFLEDLFRINQGIITIIAHNFSFDIRISGFFEWILKHKEYKGYIRKSFLLDKCFYISYENGDNKKIQFLDTFNYFKMPLSEIAKTFNEKKYADNEYNYSPNIWNKYIKENGSELVKKGTEILYKFFENFINDKNLSLGITLASTSFNTFKRDFLHRKLKSNIRINKLSLKAYRGGIVLPFILTNDFKNLIDYDINSLYPYVMANNEYSCEYIGHDYEKDIDNRYNYLCLVNYSALPGLYKNYPIYLSKNGKLMPFLSAKNVWITKNEIKKLYELGANVEIQERLIFRKANLFKEFIDKFYKFKKTAANPASRLIYKLILNSLYGKFGQHRSITEIVDIPNFIKNTTNLRVEFDGKIYSIYNDYAFISKDIEPRYIPVIAAEITANARLVNYDYWEKMSNKGNVYYTDTDSFITDIKDYDVSDELGALKIEKQGKFKINSSKDYEFIDKNGKSSRTLKSIRKNAEKIAENKYKQDKFEGIKSKRNINSVYVSKVIKKIKINNNKMYYINNIGYVFKEF